MAGDEGKEGMGKLSQMAQGIWIDALQSLMEQQGVRIQDAQIPGNWESRNQKVEEGTRIDASQLGTRMVEPGGRGLGGKEYGGLPGPRSAGQKP